MPRWHPQHYRRLALTHGGNPATVDAATAVGSLISKKSDAAPIFTLRHLAFLTGTDYSFLREIVSRDASEPYRSFRIAKSRKTNSNQSYRLISVPNAQLMRAQRWIAQEVLSKGKTHWASCAYAPKNDILIAAKIHCNTRWLIKVDVQRFFESISEISVYRVFLRLGYQPLVAFELARICTRRRIKPPKNSPTRWQNQGLHEQKIWAYWSNQMGYLPQGAPTSPMLANLAVFEMDEQIAAIATRHNLVYTRYADDLCLSSADKNFTREAASAIVTELYKTIRNFGLLPNLTKTQIIPPGARKIVLGLLVNGLEPRLNRNFRDRLRLHIYYLTHPKIGPVAHQHKRGFTSVRSLRNHVDGLIRFARHIDPTFASQCEAKLSEVNWPL
jgi:RNA-directed DNA polymerase